MVSLKKVYFKYSDNDVILRDVNLDIKKNEITVILGKNGVGKTTLLSIIDGFIQHDQGAVTKETENVFIYDNPYLYEYLTGREYLELINEISKHKISKDIYKLLESLELQDALDKIISSYSLGMKHKLALLTALVLDFKLYLIDEPLAALDPDSQEFMIEYFKNMKEDNNTLIISTHMLNVAYELADDIVIFKDSKLEVYRNNYKSLEEFSDFVINKLRYDVWIKNIMNSNKQYIRLSDILLYL